LGTHKELLENCVTYRRLWEAQGSYTTPAEVTRT